MDAEAQTKLRQKIESIIEQKPLADWVEIFKDKDCCVEPVLTFAEACASEQIIAREMIVDLKTHDGGQQQQIGSPIKFSKSTPKYDSIGAVLGQHSEQVLKEIGMDQASIQAARDAGALG
jgi:crotonobetainyl-CoA:carnitine CoA-transferase CaiB-like acyl-CoA transferase